MIGLDGISIQNLSVDVEDFINNEHLQGYLKATVNDTGEIEYYRGKYKGLDLRVNSRFVFVERNGKKEKEYRPKTLEGLENRYVMLDGSLHNYSNNDKGNYTDFTPLQGIKVINELKDNLRINPQRTLVNGFEFAFNIVTPFGCNLVYDNLICYLGEPFRPDKEGGEIFYSCKTDRYIIKIYDKGKQNKLDHNLLRVEIKVTRMMFLKTKGLDIKNLEDLLNMTIYERLKTILIETFNGILFGDRRLDRNLMTRKESDIYLLGNDPKTWNTKGKTQAERKKIQRLRKSYTGVIDKYRTGIDFKKEVLKLIELKSLELAEIDKKSVHISQHFEEEKNSEIVRISHSPLTVNDGQISLDNDIILTPSFQPEDSNKYWCSGCGKPIGTRKTYHGLDCKFNRDERNELNNPINNFRAKYYKSVNLRDTLFDVSGTLVLNEMQNEWISRKLKKNYTNKKSRRINQQIENTNNTLQNRTL